MRIKLFTALLLLLHISCMSQSVYELIEKLDKARLISSLEKKSILQERKAQEAHLKKNNDTEDQQSQEQYEAELMEGSHYILNLLTNCKMYSTTGTRSAFNFTPMHVNIPKGKENELKAALNKFIQKLLSAKFISTKTAKEATDKVKSLELCSEFEVSSFVAAATENEYFLTPDKYKKFADALLSRDLITREHYTEIMSRLGKGEFRTYDEPLRYLKNIIFIDSDNYKGEQAGYMEEVYKRTAKADPNLAFDSLTFFVKQNKRDSREGFIVSDMTVSLKKDNKWYRYSSFFGAEYKNKKPEDRSFLPEAYYQVFNKILADQQSPYRLHQVMFGRGFFAILPMTKAQFDNLMWSYTAMNSGGYIQLSYENFTNKLTQQKINEAIAVYDSLGLFSHLRKTEKDSCINEVMGKEINYYSDILSSFKNLVFEIDLEYGIMEGQYRQLTNEIISISKGNFTPTSIVDTYRYDKRKKFEYGFTLNGKTYLAKLAQNDDWLDVRFWELIEQAEEEQDKKGRFYYMHPSDGMRQIYLTHEQAAFLNQHKLIELDQSDIAR